MRIPGMQNLYAQSVLLLLFSIIVGDFQLHYYGLRWVRNVALPNFDKCYTY